MDMTPRMPYDGVRNAPGLIRGLATIDTMDAAVTACKFRPINPRTKAHAHWMHPIFCLCLADVESADQAGRMAGKASSLTTIECWTPN
jgi:hypothetical protein